MKRVLFGLIALCFSLSTFAQQTPLQLLEAAKKDKIDGDLSVEIKQLEVAIEKSKDKELDKNKDEIKILDIGSGSGCIGLTMAYELTNAKVQLIDISEKALDIAKENSDRKSVV